MKTNKLGLSKSLKGNITTMSKCMKYYDCLKQ